MKAHCLLDSDALLKYYIDLPGSEVVRYLFDRSPSATINVATTQLMEVLSFFYRLRTLKIIPTDEKLEQFKRTFFNDIKRGKILAYEFAGEHLLDFPGHEMISSVKKSRDAVDAADRVMILVAREIHTVTNGNCLLFTSDQ
ncbi:hypothetical protein ACFL1E_06275, partial [Candidatus Omnitrophota bacterium]